jgi:hypothetical protein
MTLGLGLGVACATASGRANSAEQPTMPTGQAPDSIVIVALSRTIGGWGNGATYTLTLRANGLATYDGGTRAPRLGRYLAHADSSLVLAVLVRVSQPGALSWVDPTHRCFDGEGLAITVGLTDGRRLQFGHGDCSSPRENWETARVVDSLLAGLNWLKQEK